MNAHDTSSEQMRDTDAIIISSSSAAGGTTTTTSNMRALSVFCAPKSGMSTVNASAVNSVVYEMSKDSPHFAHSQAGAAKVTERIVRLTQQRRDFERTLRDATQRGRVVSAAASVVRELESGRRLDRRWIHIDMDMFFVAVEMKERSELAGKAVAVGGIGMISTSNYEARKFGVRSAMPGFIALRLCPQLIIIPPNFDKYSAVARIIQGIFAEYDDDYESSSLDEASLDVTAAIQQRINSETEDESARDEAETHMTDRADRIAADIASEIRSRVFTMTALSCSAGIACNRSIAKIASNMNKPNGQYQVAADLHSVLSFMDALPIRSIGGIGRVMERILCESMHIQYAGELRGELVAATLLHLFSNTTAQWLIEQGLGVARCTHPSKTAPRKSISVERTFAALSDPSLLLAKCRELAAHLARDCHDECVAGRTLTLKCKSAAFDVQQKSVTLERNISKCSDVSEFAVKLLHQFMSNSSTAVRLRLMGLRLSTLTLNQPTQQPVQRTILDRFLLSSSTSPSLSRSLCPNCNTDLSDANNAMVNEHIDRCLHLESSSSPKNKRQRTPKLYQPTIESMIVKMKRSRTCIDESASPCVK